MPGNVGTNVSIRIKPEVSFGAGGSGAGAEVLRVHAGSGLSVARALIEDPEMRADGQRSMARLGSHSVAGTYPGTLSVGTWNTILAALFRAAWVNDVVITYNNGAPLTSLEVTAPNTLVMVGSTTFHASGVKVGDVIRLGTMSTAANNDVNAVVATIAANGLSLTVLGTPWTIQAADNAATLTIKKKLKNGNPLVRSSYAIEEYFTDLDESELFVGCRISSLRLSFEPNGVARVEVGVVAQTGSIVQSASAPNFTSPTEYTTIGLVAVDSQIYVAGVAMGTVTAGELVFDLRAQGMPVVGSTLTPDIWEGPMHVTGQITAIRTALTGSHLARFLAETDNVELSLMFLEPDAAVPKDFVHFFIPRIKYLGTNKTLGGDTPITEQIPIYAAAKAATTGYDAVTATISTSA